MRILITFKPERKYFLLPINYNYEISSMIYHIMSLSGPKFTSWLHSRGFQLDGKKRFKFFNFSRLFFTDKEIQKDIIKARGNFRMLFSSPIDESVITNFISGMMENSDGFYLGSKEIGTRIKVVNIQILPYPNFQQITKYIMLSPTVASQQDENKKIHYLKPTDDNIYDVLRKNLVNKYEILYMEKCPYEIDLEFDNNYLTKAKNIDDVMKLITIKTAKENTAKIKGFMLPITIISDPKIQKLAYETGLGEKNSLGFGMLEIAKSQSHLAVSKSQENKS